MASRIITTLFAAALSLALTSAPASAIVIEYLAPNVQVTQHYAPANIEDPAVGSTLTGACPPGNATVLEWRDADSGGAPDWTAPGFLSGSATQVWLLYTGDYVTTTTTVQSTAVTFHMEGDGNDGRTELRVDGNLVARLDMYHSGNNRIIVVVRNLPMSTHTMRVDAIGVSIPGFDDDVSVFGGAAVVCGSAGVPDPVQSTLPCALTVVGHNGVTSPHFRASFVIRDALGNPVPSVVSIDFTGCNNARDPGPATIQHGIHGEVSNCPLKTISAPTNAAGAVDMDLQGLALNAPQGVTPNGPCAKILADNFLLATVQVSALDIDGAVGLTAGDLSEYLKYILSPLCAGPAPNYCAIADLDYAAGSCASQDVSAADLSKWLTEALSSASFLNDLICQ